MLVLNSFSGTFQVFVVGPKVFSLRAEQRTLPPLGPVARNPCLIIHNALSHDPCIRHMWTERTNITITRRNIPGGVHPSREVSS